MEREAPNKRKLLLLACGVCLLVMTVAVSVRAAAHNGIIIYPAERAEDGVKTIVDGGVMLTYHEQTEQHEPGTGEILVNINTAYDYEMVKLLPGIGEKRAAAIIEYREMCGGFNSVEELLNVKGIGKETYEKMCMYCTVEGPRISSAEFSEVEWLLEEPKK